MLMTAWPTIVRELVGHQYYYCVQSVYFHFSVSTYRERSLSLYTCCCQREGRVYLEAGRKFVLRSYFKKREEQQGGRAKVFFFSRGNLHIFKKPRATRSHLLATTPSVKWKWTKVSLELNHCWSSRRSIRLFVIFDHAAAVSSVILLRELGTISYKKTEFVISRKFYHTGNDCSGLFHYRRTNLFREDV